MPVVFLDRKKDKKTLCFSVAAGREWSLTDTSAWLILHDFILVSNSIMPRSKNLEKYKIHEVI